MSLRNIIVNIIICTILYVAVKVAVVGEMEQPQEPYPHEQDSLINSLKELFNWASQSCLKEGAKKCQEFYQQGEDKGYLTCAMNFFNKEKNGQC